MTDPALNEILQRLVSIESYIKEHDKHQDDAISGMNAQLKESIAHYWELHSRVTILETHRENKEQELREQRNAAAIRGTAAGGLIVILERVLHWTGVLP